MRKLVHLYHLDAKYMLTYNIVLCHVCTEKSNDVLCSPQTKMCICLLLIFEIVSLNFTLQRLISKFVGTADSFKSNLPYLPPSRQA